MSTDFTPAATTSITEFLLARIAEDEATPYRLVPYACKPDCCAPAGWVGHECLICLDGVTYGGSVDAITEVSEDHAERVHRRSRVLAECKAKRAIVEHSAVMLDAWIKRPAGPYPDVTRRERSTANAILHALAAIYADHPDFDPAWA